jgi:hypothetical protein
METHAEQMKLVKTCFQLVETIRKPKTAKNPNIFLLFFQSKMITKIKT